MIEILIAICPPEMAFKRKLSRPTVPNYEARAMAYIVFMLKLLFGIDDKKEYEISQTAKKINEKLGSLDPTRQKLFVWTEWTKYIKIRKILLSKCHFQTANAEASMKRHFSKLYAEYLMKSKSNEDDGTEATKKSAKKKRTTRDKVAMENLKLIFKEIISKHHSEKNTNLINVKSSLTPRSTYFEYILNHESEHRNFSIPDFMYNDHSKTDILSFLRPNKLRKYFRQFQINLIVNELPLGDHIKFEQPFSLENRTPTNWNDLIQVKSNITVQNWIEKCKTNRKIMEEEKKNEIISTEQKVRDIVVEQLKTIENDRKMEIIKKKQQNQCKKTSAPRNEKQKSAMENVDDLTNLSDLFSLNSEEYQGIVGGLEDICLGKLIFSNLMIYFLVLQFFKFASS